MRGIKGRRIGGFDGPFCIEVRYTGSRAAKVRLDVEGSASLDESRDVVMFIGLKRDFGQLLKFL